MKKKRIMLLLIIFVIIYLFFKDSSSKTIKQDINKNYSGIGQEKTQNTDGYFSTFTTNENYKKTYIEYKQNGNSPWSNNKYWGGTMAENGCGITALAIILSGYNKQYTPEDLRQKYYPKLEYNSLSKELSNTFDIKNTDFYYDKAHFSQQKLQEHLQTNRPILICVSESLLAADDKDMVYVSNPNGGKNDNNSSGWYKFKEITPYIAKALYIKSYN